MSALRPAGALRPTTPAARLALKAAVRRALTAAGGGASFQHATRVREAALSKAASPHEDAFLALDVVADLDLDVGDPIVTAELAALQGFRLVPVEAEPAAPDVRDLATIATRAAAVQSTLAEGIAAGALDASELRAIEAEAAALRDAACDLNARARMARQAGEGA